MELGLVLTFLILAGSPPPVGAQDPSSNVEERLRTLESRQEIVLEGMENTYRNGLWFLGAIAGLMALLAAFRHLQDQKILKIQEQQLQQANVLGTAYKESITATSELLGSMRDALDYYKEAQEALKRVTDLEVAQRNESSRWEDQIRSLNDQAMELSSQCKRRSHNDPAIQHAVKRFSDEYEIVDRSFDTAETLNANGHFILAFHFRIENDYDRSLDHFSQAIELSLTHARDDNITVYRKLPTGTLLKTWLTKLANICHYHRAIIYANLGQHDTALQSFERALQLDPLDYESLTYVPEVMFLGGLAPFSRIVDKYEMAEKAINALTSDQEQSFSLKKAHLLSLVHLKHGNCYMATSPHHDYLAHRDLVAAEKYFRSALDTQPNSLFARLSLAQVLHEGGREADRQNALFESVFADAKTAVSRITEAKILMMYYYVMLICCTLGRNVPDAPATYAMRIYEQVPKLPAVDRVRIFSPLSKVDYTVNDFVHEVQGFESTKRTRSVERPGSSITEGVSSGDLFSTGPQLLR